jgi:heat shock protein HslJ
VTRTLLGALAVSVAAAGCADKVNGPTPDVLGRPWRLESVQATNLSETTPPPGDFTLRFGEDGRLDVRADCNSCGGPYALAGTEVSVGGLACTRVFCPSAPFDTEYVRLIEAATSVEQSDGILTLRSPRGVLVFTR